MQNTEVISISSKTKIKGYFYNESAGTFFVHDIDYHSNYNQTIIRVGLTHYPSVNGLMNRVFKRYRKGRLSKSVVQNAMKVLEYDPEYELFVKEDNNKNYNI